MAVSNPIKSLRDVLGVTQEKLGEKLGGLSVSQVAKLEAEPTKAQAKVLLDLAEKAGSIKHVLHFKRFLEDEPKDRGVDLNALDAAEEELAIAVVEMYRAPNPDSVIERNIGAIIWEVHSRRHTGENKLPLPHDLIAPSNASS